MLETNANEPFAAAGMTAQRLRKRNLDIHSRTDCHG